MQTLRSRFSSACPGVLLDCRDHAPARADCRAASRIATIVAAWMLTVSATRRA
jgi:hypothetical protein